MNVTHADEDGALNDEPSAVVEGVSRSETSIY